MQALIRANGLIGHILDPSAYVDPSRPDLAPTPLPVLSMSSTPPEIEASNRWWAEDNIVQHILISRLGTTPRGLFPSSGTSTWTALSIYQILTKQYGTCNFADCTELSHSLHNSTCVSGRVPDFVSKWRVGLSKLQSARFGFNIKICISLFVRGLPSIPAFNSLHADLPRRIAAIVEDSDYAAFVDLTDTVLKLDTIFRPTPQPQTSRPPRPPQASVASLSAVPTTSPAVPDPSHVPKKEQSCGNCKSRGLRGVGHTDGTCFQPDGGMEGRRDEYMANKGRVHAMIAECLENAFSVSDQILPSDDIVFSPTPDIPPLPDSDSYPPPVANLCVTPFSFNSDFCGDLYIPCDIKFPSYVALASTVLQSTALLSMATSFNALLDSGCTHHIVRDRQLFRDYTARPISVGTANCGSLDALGTGDVEFRYPFGDRFVIFTLRGCLYAPSAPINLLSVGALIERGMSCLFSPGGIMQVFFPLQHPKFPGLTFSATVTSRLSFLNLDFIPPVLPTAPLAFPAQVSTSTLPLPLADPVSLPVAPAPPSFPRLKLDSMLWHRRFGHVGMDATRAALTKDYVTGIKLDGSFIRDHCISCIVGKSPQKSYPYHGNRALNVGDLLHMDLCGPFPVQAPHGEKYFFNILDDRSNWGFTFGLRLKSDAFSKYLATEAFLARSKDITVKSIRCGGELELTAGKMGDHLTSKGIVVQRTVPYAHQQNGKSERYIRTIEEGGQALLADSGLPMSFWLDAVLTRQYLVCRHPLFPQTLLLLRSLTVRNQIFPTSGYGGVIVMLPFLTNSVLNLVSRDSGLFLLVTRNTASVGVSVISMGNTHSRMMLSSMNIIQVVSVSLVLSHPLLLILLLLLLCLVLLRIRPVSARRWGRPMMRFSVLRSFDVLLGNINVFSTLMLVLGVIETWLFLALLVCLASMGVLSRWVQLRMLICRPPLLCLMLSSL